jgi:hypothetical protein
MNSASNLNNSITSNVMSHLPTMPTMPAAASHLPPGLSSTDFMNNTGMTAAIAANPASHMQMPFQRPSGVPGFPGFPGFGTPGFAAGGVALKNGAFVVDARTVSELGNGSSSAGQDILSRHGGMPVRGNGDGVSDSIPANVDGRQPARVARDEVVMGPDAVRHMGGGNANKGAQKLYSLMNKAHKARSSAGRGKDTKLRTMLG